MPPLQNTLQGLCQFIRCCFLFGIHYVLFHPAVLMTTIGQAYLILKGVILILSVGGL